MAKQAFLAVDLGAESGRTLLGRFDGATLSLEETHRFPNGPVRLLDTLYWDMLRLWQEIKLGISRSVQSAGVPACIGVDTWGVDFGFLDAGGRLLGNPVCYRDARTEGMIEQAFSMVPKQEIYERTGLQFMRFNSLIQLLAMRQRSTHDPFAAAEKLLFIPDLFNYFLTGEVGAEYTIASTSQMLDARGGDWARELVAAMGIPTRLLPAVLPTGKVLGSLTAGVASETGALGARVVASAGHDTAAAVAAVPAMGQDWCYISSGTWSLMGAELPAPAISPATLAANFTNEGGVGGTIRFLKNIMGLWLVQQCRRSFERLGQNLDYTTLTRLAEAALPFGPVVDPDFDGFMNPEDMPQALRAYCANTKQEPPDDEGRLIRCCLESLALRYRRTLEQIETVMGRRLETIHIVGGGSQNELLCQMTADCCQRVVIAGPVEATAMGNCLVQAMGVGELGSLADARAIVRASCQPRRFEPRRQPQWDERYDLFKKLAN